MPPIPPPMTMTSMIRFRPKAQDLDWFASRCPQEVQATGPSGPGYRPGRPDFSRKRRAGALILLWYTRDRCAGWGKRAMIAPNAPGRDAAGRPKTARRDCEGRGSPGLARFAAWRAGPVKNYPVFIERLPLVVQTFHAWPRGRFRDTSGL